MSDQSNIEWTEATWNPIVGCSIVSHGCTNCYAMKMAARIEAMNPASHYAGTVQKSKAGPVWNGKLVLAPDNILLQPLRWKQPRLIFANSMGDLFHEDVPDEWIDKVFAVMALCPQHTFQILTKRALRMREYIDDLSRAAMISSEANLILGKENRLNEYTVIISKNLLPLRNVWFGVSTEDQKRADERIPQLLSTKRASVRFISAEPLLGPIDLTNIHFANAADGSPKIMIDALSGLFTCGEDCDSGLIDKPDPKLDWVIVGGESGPGARPMNPQWARDIRDQCLEVGTPFFFKQWGEFVSVSEVEGPGEHHTFPDGRTVRRTGKQRAGRFLDGREHNDMPARAA